MAGTLWYQALELVYDRRKPVHGSLGPEELAMSPRGVAAHGGARRNVAEDRALGGNPGTVSNHKMIGNPDVSCQDYIIADAGAPSDSDTCHDQAALTDMDVVADVDQVVQFGAPADYGVVDAAAINGGVRSNLDLVSDDASADVRNSCMALPIREVPESIPAYDGTSLEDHVLADLHARIADHPGVDDGALSNDHTFTQRHALAQPNSVAQTNVGAEYNVGSDRNACSQQRAGSDAGTRIDRWRVRLLREEGVEHLYQSAVWIGYYDPGSWSGSRRQGSGNQHSAGPGALQLTGVAARDGER
jgi:hypothetical protein